MIVIALVLPSACWALQITSNLPLLPALQRDLGTSVVWATWIATAFILVGIIATPLAGKLGDQFGRRRLMLVSLALFTVGAFASAAAPDVWTLIGCRAFQALGA